MSKEKILILTSSFPRWKEDSNLGGGDFILKIGRQLKSKIKFYVIAPLDNNSLKLERMENLIVYRFKQGLFINPQISYGSGMLANIKKQPIYFFYLPFFIISQIYSLHFLIRKYKFKIVHAHWFIPCGLALVLYKKLFFSDIKIIITAHGSDVYGFNNLFGKLLLSFILRNSDKVSVVSDGLKNTLEKINNTNIPIYTYPMGVDPFLFNKRRKSTMDIKYKFKINNLLILYCGVIVEQKGIRYLLEAMVPIVSKYPHIKMLIAGEGDLMEEMIQFTKNNKIDNNIVFFGNVKHSEIHNLYNESDIFILPSMWEGTPISILEALSSKLAVIASSIPAIDFIDPNEDIIFRVSKKNSRDIEEKLQFIIENYNSKKIIRRKVKGRITIVKKFQWKIIAENYLNLYNKI